MKRENSPNSSVNSERIDIFILHRTSSRLQVNTIYIRSTDTWEVCEGVL